MAQKESADGMSTSTWSLQTLGFLIFVIYSIRSGYALSTFVDFAALAVQSLVILGLASFYQKEFNPLALAPFIGAVVAWTAPIHTLQLLQGTATVSITLALLPQIVRNFIGRSRGGFSAVSALLACVGNGARVYTTLTLANGNPLLLAQFGCGLTLNTILLIQTLVWP